MNCEECKEQVFELIEREAVDPEGVRAILAECPDCRAEFDAMKVALAAADELPIEEPPGEIDALILRTAELRSQAAAPEEAQVIPFRKRLLQTPPWAMAAIALLAVGVGVWSIPRTVQFESDAAPTELEAKEAVQAGRAPVAALALEDEEMAMDRLAEAPADEYAEPAKSAERPESRQAAYAKRKRVDTPQPASAKVDADDLEMERANAPVMAKDEQAGKATQPRAASSGAKQVAAAPEEADVKGQERSACKAKVTAFEKRLREDKRYEPPPEQELTMGRCYQALGNTAKARQWLERAAADPATRARAQKALERLTPK